MSPNQQPPNQSGQFPQGTPPNQLPNQPAPPQSGNQPQIPPQPPIGQPPWGTPPQSGSSGQIPNYGGSSSGNGSKKGIIIGIIVGAVVLLVGLAIALFLVLGDGDENTESAGTPNEDTSDINTESAGTPNEDTSDIVSKMNRIASAADMECKLLEGEERREAIGEFDGNVDDTSGFGNEEYYNLLLETFEDLTFFECERGDWEYSVKVSYPAERYLSSLQAAFDDPVKYGVFTEDVLQSFRGNAEKIRETCADDSQRMELNEGFRTAGTEYFLSVDGFIFTIPFLTDREDFKDAMRENGFKAEDPEIDVDACSFFEEAIEGLGPYDGNYILGP